MEATQPTNDDSPTARDFEMKWSWKLALSVALLLGVGALLTAGIELTGLVQRGSLLGQATDAERWIAVVVGVLLAVLGATALRHARCSVAADSFRCLGFGLPCKTRALRISDVRRWGHAVGRNRGRREPLLLFERCDGTTQLVKLAMYTRQRELLAALRERLGPETAASATLAGVRFDE